VDRSFALLTHRERECLYLTTRFLRPKEVAAQLGISPKTVEAHLARVVVKLGADNSRHAAKLYADHLSAGLSENTLGETFRLSDSSIPQSLVVADEDDERRGGQFLFDPEMEVPAARLPVSLRRSFIERWKRIDANDLTNPTMLQAILLGAIIAAVALATAINLVGAFHQFASIFSRP
jgi:DNA-binding CsgD family transcriptional regulator